jgi:hypothetical protein
MSDPRNSALSGRVLSPEEKRQIKARDFYGFEIRTKEDTNDNLASFVPRMDEGDPAIIVGGGGFAGVTLDTRGDNFSSERELIFKYRLAAMTPEVDRAIQDIVNEAIVCDDETLPVSINLDNTKIPEGVREKIFTEFDYILSLLDFRKFGTDVFKRWYVDGKLAYHIVIDMGKPKNGIQELRPISPIKIRKVKEIEEKVDSRTGVTMITGTDEYFVYSDDGFSTSVASPSIRSGAGSMGLKLPTDSVLYITSGVTDSSKTIALSHLHKALKRVNQLQMMEDSLLIYRFSRAPERRIFKISTGDMTKAQGEAYIQSLMAKHKNAIKYDSNTGELRDSRSHMHMLEDFWLPVSADGRGTDVTTLQGGANLGEIEDILYFQEKLYESLNVPKSRLDSSTGYDAGRTTEITRDEIRFQKFVNQLRVRFAELFKEALGKQLILKGILTVEEWDEELEKIIIDYAKDSFFTELKELEILRERLGILDAVSEYEGVYFSKEYIRKKILGQKEQEIEEIKDQIRKESLNNDELPDAERDGAMGGGGGDLGGLGGGGGGAPGGLEGEEEFDTDLPDDGLGGDTGSAQVLGDPEGASTELGADSEASLEDPEFTGDEEDFADDSDTEEPLPRT